MLVRRVMYMFWKLYLIPRQVKWLNVKDFITQNMGKKEDEIFINIVNVF